MSRSDKALLLFNAGEITPLLAGRTDLERVSGACRSLQNMVVEVGGAATRRKGLQFVAEAGVIVPLIHVSHEGDAEYYGITEFGAVSDPPRKYRVLRRNYGSASRVVSGFTPETLFLGPGAGSDRDDVAEYFRVRYSTLGVRDADIHIGNLATTGTVLAPNSFEQKQDGVPTANVDWTPHAPVWTREKRAKYFSEYSSDSAETLDRHYAISYPSQSGIGGSDFQWHFTMVWMATFWRVTFQASFGIPTVSGSEKFVLHARYAQGNQDPGAPTLSDPVIVFVTTAAGGLSRDVDLPPGMSARFLIYRINGFDQGPGASGGLVNQWPEQQWPMPFSDALDADTDSVEWFYFPETEEEHVWEYREGLHVEDTLEDAIARASGVIVSDGSTARTTTLTGGITAESHDPIQWAGRVVYSTKSFGGLTVGNRYSVTVLVRTNTIGLGDFLTTVVSGGEFVALAPGQLFTFENRAPHGFERQALDMTATDLGPDPAPPAAPLQTETVDWWGRVLANGGTLSVNSLAWADALVIELKAQGLWNKTVYLLTVLGTNVAGWCVPLRDRDGAGAATPTAFDDADGSEATGLQGDGTSKFLAIPRTPGELGTSFSGGLFWWELGFTGAGNVEPIGCYNTAGTTRFVLDLRSTLRSFRWGDPGTSAGDATAAGNGFWHGRRASATSRALFLNGASVATNVSNDNASGAGDRDIRAWGSNNGDPFWPGRGGVCGMTDGTESDPEALALYETLRDFLMTPTGRI